MQEELEIHPTEVHPAGVMPEVRSSGELAFQSQEVLGSVVEIKLPVRHASFFSSCFDEMRRIERNYSRFLDNSELSRLNQHLGQWQEVSSEMARLLCMAEQFRKKTDGHFDITIKSALDKLGYDKHYSFAEKKNLLDFSAFFQSRSPPMEIDIARDRVLLRKEIDFGGFGKGFALDQAAHFLEKSGISHYYLNAGGDIYAKRGEGEEPWIILLEHPDDPGRAIGKLELDGRSIAGSAPNRRKWGKNGELHHLINAKTGRPAQGVKAIFTLAHTGVEADAYATALFTAGFENGIALSQRLPVECLTISSEDKMYSSPGFNAEFFK